MEAVKRYRKKPVSIEAVQLDKGNVTDVLGWIQGHGQEAVLRGGPGGGSRGGSILIHTLEGDVWAQQGDWVIHGVAGEFYPCKPEIFAETYEGPVD
jgi:hypothetical protein